MNNNEYSNEILDETQDDSNSKYLFAKILSKWPYIIISVILCVVASNFYTKYLTPVFVTKASILIKDDNSSGGGNKGLSDLTALLNPTSSVDNEAQIIQTRHLMETVVSKLDAEVSYQYEGRFKSSELYPSPFIVKFVNKSDTLSYNFV